MSRHLRFRGTLRHRRSERALIGGRPHFAEQACDKWGSVLLMFAAGAHVKCRPAAHELGRVEDPAL